MTDRSTPRNEVDSVDDSAGFPEERTRSPATDAYEIEDGVVIYDVDNPLAWVEADATVDLEGMA